MRSESADAADFGQPNNWLDNLSRYETNTYVHPQVYGRDQLGGAPAYTYVAGTDVSLRNGKQVTCYYRTPAIDFTRSYACCIGAAQTFGRGVTRPYPAILNEKALDVQIANFGYGGAGPEFYLGIPEYLKILSGGKFVVIQVMPARSSSCSLYKVIWGNRGFRQKDGTSMTFYQFAASMTDTREREQYFVETRERYLNEMIALIQAVSVPTVLVWISKRPRPVVFPDIKSTAASPQMVDLQMVSELRKYVTHYAEVVGRPSEFSRYYPSQRIHDEASEQVLATLVRHGLVQPKHQTDVWESKKKASRRASRWPLLKNVIRFWKGNDSKLPKLGHDPRPGVVPLEASRTNHREP